METSTRDRSNEICSQCFIGIGHFDTKAFQMGNAQSLFLSLLFFLHISSTHFMVNKIWICLDSNHWSLISEAFPIELQPLPQLQSFFGQTWHQVVPFLKINANSLIHICSIYLPYFFLFFMKRCSFFCLPQSVSSIEMLCDKFTSSCQTSRCCILPIFNASKIQSEKICFTVLLPAYLCRSKTSEAGRSRWGSFG